MSGTKEGAKKAHLTKLDKYGDSFYRKIGRQSWKNERDHNVGFAKLDKETHIEISRRGGKKTKQDYKETNAASEASEVGTDTGE